MVRDPEHLRTFPYVGAHRYFLTFCTHARQALFSDAVLVRLVCDQFLRAASDAGIVIVAYCFMPDHVHLLVEGVREDADLKAFIKTAKQLSAYHVKQ